ncbi:MAG: Ig-like domain-containing protein [bacterium]|nr:Ig-like domain-containing protein [bacterium]
MKNLMKNLRKHVFTAGAPVFVTAALLLSVGLMGSGCDRYHTLGVQPEVTSVTPANAAASVAVNTKITATFNEEMDPLTITTANFTLLDGATSVSGAVVYDEASLTATFTPSSNLSYNTLYTATITTGIRNSAGTALASSFVWSFSTAAAPDTTAPLVSFTAPADGDLSVATNRKIVATFNEAMDPATIIAANVRVTGPGGNVSGTVTYAAGSNAASFTPASSLAVNTLYTATITTAVKDVAGNALAANYVWSFTTAAAPDTTAPRVSSTNPENLALTVAISAKIKATFSEPMDPATIITANFTLMKGATAVSGAVAYDASNNIMTFTPLVPLTLGTTYTATITTGAKDLAGNILASGLIPNPWTFTTEAAPSVPVRPTVTSTVPANGDTGVQINRRITATFSEPMILATISTASFKVTGPLATVVTGVVTYSGSTAVFTPSSALAANSIYTARITTTVKNLAGIAMLADFTWSFTTGLTADTTAPTLIMTGASDGDTGLPINRVATATFSEPMDPATLVSPAVNFTLKEFIGGNIVPGTVTYLGNTATFDPTSDLLPSTKYTSEILTGAKDLAQNALVSGPRANPWSWTTGPAADTTRPEVTLTNPADLATNVSIDKKINATFSEGMSLPTIVTANFKLTEARTGNDVPGTVAYDVQNNIATFLPLTNLTYDTGYTATVTNQARDLAGNALVVPAVSGLPKPNPWTFRTAPSTLPPAPLAINLRSAASFGIASRAGLTTTGVTVVNGDVALYPLASCTDATGNNGASQTCLVKTYVSTGGTGMAVNGSIYYAGDPFDNGGTANSVTNDLNIAWVEGKNKVDTQGAIAADEMGGKTLLPGVYHNAALGLMAGGLAQLDAQNDATAVFIFKVDSSFVDSGTLLLKSEIRLINGAQAKNVWFVTGLDITIGSGTKWNGNILAGRTATILDGSTVIGRVLGGASGAGAITLTGAASPSVTTITVPQ